MTKNKRFVNKGKDIFQYGEWWCSANGEHCADVIATAINELIEENEQLKSENKNLKSNVDDLMNMELEDRDIVCQAGKFRLEEWGKHRLHQFYDGDILLEDETVVIRLMDLTTENEQLKQQVEDLEFALRTKLAYQRVEKEEHSDSMYDFKKKLEKW